MKLTIVAATGGIGRHLVEQAVASGHDVTAVARRPRELPDGVRTVAVDLTRPDTRTLAAAVRGADAVLSGLGPRNPRADAGITSRGTRAIVAAMRAEHLRRIIIVSAAPVGPVPVPGRPTPPRHDPGDGFFMRYLGVPLTRAMLGRHYADLAVTEQTLRDSGLEWTVSRPPKLTDKPLTGRYRTAWNRNIRGGFSVSRADVAHHMLAMVNQPDTIEQVVGIAN
ncbi:NAD(P)-dependent oxidoreductase [Streptomyces europaeiscabiei]|uniref:NAD(P)-dependent oxidoreductase n=1 Tax=Streptomyces europaeiscabiei TaxID=146819 RepID=UPI0029B58380|nr:NAD(P)H-binding protein [Streptomyces europaeiscabiei]MDX3586244.1 NAD(P)H-binding protein [Streptomyces europaeiscabiei]MDX3612825.1 NAD(P)H-binding protein [Streptomyces europaeiscabiei]WUD30197.1 NAD(P)H-binding protein [Streptomyces europaeiscabiei]